ncbi:hypothetical protein HHL22_10995 [Hymenobacter sp. RP-2-7]|uniref:Glyoxalase n=1 Tax=Hymenobacter polaris TaxID=2682546 RepID=A0A7Y0AEJ5_9BACT|nr:hypothetical protein [Hymenobacter polaris]NML65732.1 hypothetical protein [Hymenobacter polaris]
MSSFYPRPPAALLALRPAIAGQPAAIPTPATVPDFQHQVLRPLLKLQHEVAAGLLEDFAQDYRLPDPAANPAEATRQRAALLARNARLRATLVGIVVGLLTPEELAFYRPHRAELNRRLLDMLAVRLGLATN